MNHITHDYTCYGVILLKLLQRIQQNCTDNSHHSHKTVNCTFNTFNTLNTYTPYLYTKTKQATVKNDQQFYKLILIHHYIYKITTNKMNHIRHNYTCYGDILLKFLQRIQQNCTDNSHHSHKTVNCTFNTFNTLNTYTPYLYTKTKQATVKNDQQFYKLILIHHYIYKITTNKMNHIRHNYTCYGDILLKFLERIQQNCTDNSHLCLNYKRYFIHTQCHYCPDSKLTDTETQFENI